MIEQLIHEISKLVHGLHHLVDGLEKDRQERKHHHHKIMTALETLTQAVTDATTAQTDLITAVNAAVVRLGSPGATDAQLLTLASAIAANTASDQSLVDTLNAALNPPPVPTP